VSSDHASKVGLHISREKTKIMSTDDLPIQPVSISQRSLECVEDFLYLGSYTSNQADIDVDIRARLSKVASVFQRLHSIWASHSISNSIKFHHLYASIVLSTALHARETWKFTTRIRNTMDVFHRRCIRKTLELTWQDRIHTYIHTYIRLY